MKPYSVAIQAHPRRAIFIPYLKSRLGDVPVAWDERQSVWDTWKRAAALADPDAEFHLIVQDDAVIGGQFGERLEKALATGYSAFCLFCRLKSGRTHGDFNAAARAGRVSGGFAFPRMQFGVAMALRTALLGDLVEFCDAVGGPENQDDLRVSRYLNREGLDVWYPLPSLVDHRSGVSVIDRKLPPNRRATWFE